MRPTELIISAFGPYAGEVRLEMDALSDQGVYLITGDTGAGKTTIFDAIAFVLYGTASGDSRKPRMLRSKYAKPDEKTFVEMAFLYNGGDYRVRRNPEYMRAKQRGQGETKEKPDAQLHLPDGRVVTGDKAVTEEVETLLGLSREQFSQIAMLAQGSFSRLLSGRTEDRGAIFRDIFSTRPFQVFQEKMKEQARQLYGRYMDSRKSMEQYALGVLVDRSREDMALRWEAAGKAEPEAMLQILGEIICWDEQSEETQAAKINGLRERASSLELKMEKARRTVKIQQDIAQAQTCLEVNAPLEKTAKERYEQEKGRQEERTRVIREIGKLEEDLQAYSRWDALEAERVRELGRLEQCKRELEEAEKEHVRHKEQLARCDGELEALERTGEDYQAAVAAQEKLAGYKARIEGLGQELFEYREEHSGLEKARGRYGRADEARRRAEAAYSRAYQTFLDNQAGLLASRLKPGSPCPVCGSLSHPAPACCQAQDQVASKELVDQLREEAGRKAREAERLSLDAGRLAGSLETRYVRMRRQIDEEVSSWKTAWREKLRQAEAKAAATGDEQEARSLFLSQWAEMLTGLKSGVERQEAQSKEKIRELSGKIELKNRLEKQRPVLRDSQEKAAGRMQRLQELLIEARTRLDGLERQKGELEQTLPFKDRKAAEQELGRKKQNLEQMEQSFQEAEAHFTRVSRAVSDARAKIEALKEQMEEEMLLQIEGKGQAEQIEELKALQAEVSRELEAGELEKNGVHHRLETNRTAYENILRQKDSMEQAQKQWTWVKALADTASGEVGGKEKITLETYAQMACFERIIARANTRFMVMSGGQYELKRCTEEDNRGKNGLGLAVVDHYNGTERSVRTLSGGESFQASLSLALGLSDEIQASAGGIRLDTLFVDEGFGSLDEDTLNLAMKALEDLAQGKRLVGIISHVPELKERIERRVVVTKEKSGGSFARIER